MSSRYDVIGPNTLEAIRRDSEIIRLKDRIEKLEAALRKVLAQCSWYDAAAYDDFEETIRKALEGKDD